MTDQTTICMLGMHRSGTSVIARVLNLLGVDLGQPESHLQPNVHNPKGYWEHRAIVRLNDALLKVQRATWHEPPLAPHTWSKIPQFDALCTSARNIIAQDFADAHLWGFKDPRTCLTLPFWQAVVPAMRYVLCFRNPFEVIESLHRRDRFTLEKSLYLWLVYTRAAIAHTAQAPCILAFYEDIVNRSSEELDALAAFLDLKKTTAVERAIAAFVDADLRHHAAKPTTQTQKNAPWWEILCQVQHFYQHLRHTRSLDRNSALAMLENAIGALAPVVKKQERIRKNREYQAWRDDLHRATAELADLIPENAPFILVDENQWQADRILNGHRPIPFVERNGQYWGPPPDDCAAVEELERLRKIGAQFIAFGWHAFWWLEHYRGLRRHLHAHYPCLLDNRRLAVFDLRS